MKIEQKDIITLSDDKRYFVVRIIVLDGVKYYYVSNVENPYEVKFLYEKDDKLIQIHDNDELLTKVMGEIVKTIDINKLTEEIKKYNNE